MEEDFDDGRVQYYYSREHRLSRAPASVRALYDEKQKPKAGFFASLTGDRSRTFVFLSIITVCVAMLLFSFALNDGTSKILHNTELKFTAAKGEGKSYLTLKKTAKGPDAWTGEVPLVFSNDAGALHSEVLFFNADREETFRFSVPLAGKTLLVLAGVGEEKALLKIYPR
jgi:hypothetical protein